MSEIETPGFANNANSTGIAISSMISNESPCPSSSRVVATEPSTEFSIGTRAPKTFPERTRFRASRTDSAGISSALWAIGICKNAASVKVPFGPKYANEFFMETQDYAEYR